MKHLQSMYHFNIVNQVKKPKRLKVKLARKAKQNKAKEIVVIKTEHEDVKPFPCQWCQNCFTNQSDFEAHQSSAHGIFKCYACDLTFHQTELLIEHNALVHNLNLHDHIQDIPTSAGEESQNLGKIKQEPFDDS